jgi:hypothetical protein
MTTTTTLRDLLRNARKTTVTSESSDTIEHHIILGGRTAESHAKAVAKERTLALSQGHTVIEADGTRVWRDTQAIHDPAATGSAAYQWHDDNERVRCERIEFTLTPDAPRPTRRTLRRCWGQP